MTTGSLLIWDTGEYEVVSAVTQDSSLTDEELEKCVSELEKLAAAFTIGKIQVKLRGSRLPTGYVLCIRRSKDVNLSDRSSGKPRRKKVTQAESDKSDFEAEGWYSDAEEAIHTNNAYPGARNSIGSVRQRTWYASMDRVLSGFRKMRQNGQTKWIRDGDPEREQAGTVDGGFKPFFVRGREYERSIGTDRLARDVMQDEGVCGYVPRAGWRRVLE